MENSVLIYTPRLLIGELMRAALADCTGIGPVVCVSTPKDLMGTARKRPWALVVVDADSPGKETFQALDQLRRRRRDVPLFFFSDRPTPRWVSKATHLRSVGFVGACTALDDFLRAVRMALKGHTHFSPCALDVLNQIARGDQPPLGPRDLAVLSLIADGSSSKEASRILGISPKGVDAIRSRLMSRFGARSSAALVKCAYEQRLIEGPWECRCRRGHGPSTGAATRSSDSPGARGPHGEGRPS